MPVETQLWPPFGHARVLAFSFTGTRALAAPARRDLARAGAGGRRRQIMTESNRELDTFGLDELVDRGTPSEDLVGRRVRWHRQYTGVVVELANGKLAIRFRMACGRCSVRRRTVYVTSGCHAGAWCYVSDPKTGAHLADLRNQIVCCWTCETPEANETVPTSKPSNVALEQPWSEAGPDEDPTSRLISSIVVLGTFMHLEAIAVGIDANDIQRADHSDESLASLASFAEPDGPFETTEIHGRSYVLAAYPFN